MNLSLGISAFFMAGAIHTDEVSAKFVLGLFALIYLVIAMNPFEPGKPDA